MSDRDKPMSFDEWLKIACNFPPTKEVEGLARAAWKAGGVLLMPEIAKAHKEGFAEGRASAEQPDPEGLTPAQRHRMEVIAVKYCPYGGRDWEELTGLLGGKWKEAAPKESKA